MSLYRFAFVFFLLSLLSFDVKAQHLRGVCGNTYHDQMSQIDRYMANKKAAKTLIAKSRNEITYIPIQFHIITKNNGSGATELTDLLAQMCHLNEIYSQFDIVFYQSELPKYLASDVIFDDHTLTSGQFTMRQRRNREALNIWIVNDATPSNAPAVGVTLGYYDTVNDWIIIRRNQINETNNTLAHEVGHFFSLFHPHLGWDAEPYDLEKHGNPVIATAPSGGSTELVDGSNCETAGDMLCDTPPDYNFALSWNNCNYNVDVKDPKGQRVNPDETLIMSYFSDECTNKFSPAQINMILADIASPKRTFLRLNNYTPLATEITESPTLLAPAEDAVTSTYNKVYLKWQAVAGADSYLVEVDRSSSFNIDKFKFITTETLFLVDNLLDPNKNYRWRVTPLNASYVCAAPSATIKFKTGLSTSAPSIDIVNAWTIQPNPIKDNPSLSVFIEAQQAFEADLKIYNLTGQLVKSQLKNQVSSGNTNLMINIQDLVQGVYLVVLESEEGILNKKLVVQ